MNEAFRGTAWYIHERIRMRSLDIDYDDLVQEYDDELEPINEPLKLGWVVDITPDKEWVTVRYLHSTRTFLARREACALFSKANKCENKWNEGMYAKVRSIFSWFNGVEGTITEMYKNLLLLEDANGIEYQVYYHHLRDRAGEKRNNPFA